MNISSKLLALVSISLIISCTNIDANNSDNPENSTFIKENYTKASYQIQMRDGIKLYTTVYSPKDTSISYPIMYNRTPYSVAPYDENKFRGNLGPSPLFEKEKYIFVYQDVRGKFMSEGEFVDMRPMLNDTTGTNKIDESTDAYDTIDWLIKNIKNNNGKVGMWGISYPGFYAAAALVKAHSALKAVSPQAPIADWYWDDFHHNGAFFLPHFFHFFYVFGQERTDLTQNWPKNLELNNDNAYDFFLNDLGALKNINPKFYKNKIAFWNEIADHPNYDEFWQKRNILPHLKNVKPAVLVVGGLFDAEDLYGSQKVYQEIEKNNPEVENNLVLGPWIHGGWARTDGTHLGTVSFGKTLPTPSEYYLSKIEFPFFQHHLKGKKAPDIAEATIFRTGENKWEKFDKWHSEKIEKKNIYFGEKSLSFKKYSRKDKNKFDEFVSDPTNPVPFSEENTMRMTAEYMVANQAYLLNRKDILSYETAVLTEDITFAGNLLANLYVSTNQQDADWIVKIIDVYPNDFPDFEIEDGKNIKMGNYHQLLRSEVFRGRYRNSFEKPEPFIPNKVTKVSFELLDVLHTFKKGHKIMVQIHSTWFPMIDRNPQQWFNNIYTEPENKDFIKANHRIYRSKKFPSHIEVGILEN